MLKNTKKRLFASCNSLDATGDIIRTAGILLYSFVRSIGWYISNGFANSLNFSVWKLRIWVIQNQVQIHVEQVAWVCAKCMVGHPDIR